MEMFLWSLIILLIFIAAALFCIIMYKKTKSLWYVKFATTYFIIAIISLIYLIVDLIF